jgi:hypothetical protein
MESSVIAALAATAGSLVGASASIVTTWISQLKQAERENRDWQLRERQSLYSDFIMEASRLVVDTLGHTLEGPEQLVVLYGYLSRIRLLSSQEVLDKADEFCRRIVEFYQRPNMTAAQIRAILEAHQFDPLMEFSAVCREELTSMGSGQFAGILKRH